jgi:hypothetical protein
MNNLGDLSAVSLAIGDTILWIFFAVAVVVFALMSLIYLYHWRTYGTGNRVLKIVEKIYILVGLFLIILSAAFIAIH